MGSWKERSSHRSCVRGLDEGATGVEHRPKVGERACGRDSKDDPRVVSVPAGCSVEGLVPGLDQGRRGEAAFARLEAPERHETTGWRHPASPSKLVNDLRVKHSPVGTGWANGSGGLIGSDKQPEMV
jgi:hypothetical protein